MHRTFHNLSPKECLTIYPEIIKNSDTNWRASEILANNQIYGQAISLAILSIEENIKAILIMLDGRGFRLRGIKGFKGVLEDHHMRYYLSFIMSAGYVMGNKMLYLFDLVRFPGKNPSLLAKLMLMMNNRELLENFAIEKLKLFFDEIACELDWFNQLDDKRKAGLYVDFKDKLLSPEDYGLEDYSEVYQKLSKVKIVCKNLIEAFDYEFKNHRDTIIGMSKSFDAAFYVKLSESMEKTGKKQRLIFDQSRSLLKRFFDEA